MRIGVFGLGRLGPRLASLMHTGEVAGDVTLAGWAPSNPAESLPSWARTLGLVQPMGAASLLREAEAVVVDLSRDGRWHSREVLTETALDAGKAVLVDAPLADLLDTYDRIERARERSGARLLSVRPLRRTRSVRSGLEAVLGRELGEILAVYASLHLPASRAGGGPDRADNVGSVAPVAEPPEASLGQYIADLLDPALSFAGSSLSRLYALARDGEADGSFETVHVVARTAREVVVTLDVARSLPTSLGTRREALFEVTGEHGFLRVAPDAADVRVVGNFGEVHLPWRDDPLGDAIQAWLLGEEDTPLERAADREVIAALRMMKRSRAIGQAVGAKVPGS